MIKGGRVVNDDGTTLADVFIEEGVIKYVILQVFFMKINHLISSRQIGLNLVIPGGTKTIDATGKLVMPGMFFLDRFI